MGSGLGLGLGLALVAHLQDAAGERAVVPQGSAQRGGTLVAHAVLEEVELLLRGRGRG